MPETHRHLRFGLVWEGASWFGDMIDLENIVDFSTEKYVTYFGECINSYYQCSLSARLRTV